MRKYGWLTILVLALPLCAQQNDVALEGVNHYLGDQIKGVGDKFINLAKQIPTDKYTWRPAPDVRSISEVFLHVATANYTIPPRFGTPLPAEIDTAKLEKSPTDKAK